MRVFKYWRSLEATINIKGIDSRISCAGGSNYSESDALTDADRRLDGVRRRIDGREKGKGSDYEADIREEPITWIGKHDVITRNRYGAEVLNSDSCIFIDVDEPAFRIWEMFSRFHSREQKKQAVLKYLERRIKNSDVQGYGIRIYETHSGMRVILDGRTLDPKSRESKKLLKSFNADRLYALLCRKQNCYRARLTPKPYRIKMPAIRLRYPYDEKDLDRIKAWTKEYAARSERYATCRLVHVSGSIPVSLAVRYHDERTRAQSKLPLA